MFGRVAPGDTILSHQIRESRSTVSMERASQWDLLVNSRASSHCKILYNRWIDQKDPTVEIKEASQSMQVNELLMTSQVLESLWLPMLFALEVSLRPGKLAVNGLVVWRLGIRFKR